MGMTAVIKTLVAGSLLILMAGCCDNACEAERAPSALRPELRRMDARDKAMSATGKAHFKQLYSKAAPLGAFLNNTTVRSFDLLHGAQVEALLADGRTFLWYPGNKSPVAGNWQIKPSLDGPDLCFRYGENSYNPVTRQHGSAWECGDASLYLLTVTEVVDGDPLRLASGRIPFVLTKDEKSITSLAAKAGHPGTYPNKVDW